MQREARAPVDPIRQSTQFNCMAASLCMSIKANGIDCTTEEVNKVMGARPMKGARWEEALAAAQHYGMRATLTVPATVSQLKAWTDRGVPVMIAWNPEDREWSHASVVFDVTDGPDGRLVHVADPNIPNPEKTVRVVPEDQFYGKWFEKWPDYLVRRPALAVEREITVDGRQVMASRIMTENQIEAAKKASWDGWRKTAEAYDCWKDWKSGTLTWQEYQNCLKQFEDESSYRPDYSAQAKWYFAWADIAKLMGRTRDEEFIRSVAGYVKRKGRPSPKQGKILDKMKRRYTRELKDPERTIRRLKDEARDRAEAEQRRFEQELADLEKTLPAVKREYWNHSPRGRSSKFETWHYQEHQVVYADLSWDVQTGEALLGISLWDPERMGYYSESGYQRIGIFTQDNIDDLLPRAQAAVERAKKGLEAPKRPPRKEEPKPAPTTKTRVDIGYTNEHIKALEDLLAGRPGDGFVKGMLALVRSGKPLTEKQLSATRRKFYQARMRDMADLFRPPKTGAVLPTVWVVSDPKEISTLGDIMSEVRARDLGALAAGTGASAWKHENTALHDDRRSALEDAQGRLKKLWKGNVPLWVGAGIRGAAYKGNPNRKPIYPHEIDHGYDQPLAGGTDVMKRLQNKLLYEQGMPQRPENPKVSSDMWQNWAEVPPPDQAPPGLIEPERNPDAIDPEAADAFWFVEKEPAVVWRNYHFPNRSVMQAPDQASYFTLVPADEIGKWGGAAWQLVSPPNNPRTAMDPINELNKLAADEPLVALEEFAGCAKGDTSCDPTEHMSEADKKKWEAMNKKHRDVVKKKHQKGAGSDPLQFLERIAGADDEKEGRFEEGKPADPCENMSETECKEWRANTEKHKDKFKKEGASRNQVKRWMVQNYEEFIDRRTGEVNMTDLAENAAWKFDPSDTWLDDETHWVWDLAEEISDQVERGRLASCEALSSLERLAGMGEAIRNRVDNMMSESKSMITPSPEKGAADDDEDEKEARWKEDSHPSDEEITKNMSPADKEKWLKHKGEVGKKAYGNTEALQAVWDAWDALDGTSKIYQRDAFLHRADSLATAVEIEDDLYNTPPWKAGKTLGKLARSIEKQSRSWRTAYNLAREGKIEIDYGRLARDLGNTLDKLQETEDLIARIEKVRYEDLDVWENFDLEWDKASSAANLAIKRFVEAIAKVQAEGRTASEDPLAALQRVAAKNPTVYDLKNFMKKNDIPGEVSGRGGKWEVEVPDEAAHAMFEQAFERFFPGVGYGGYRAGYGGWVLTPDYQSKGDWGDPSSGHHYAAFEETVDLYVGVDDVNQEVVGPATDNPDAASKRWWRGARGIDFSVYKLQDVPIEEAEAFTDFGTRAPQRFRDGRAAWQAAKKYRPRGIAASDKTAGSIQFEVLLKRINLKNPDTLPFEYKLNSRDVQDVVFGGLFGNDAEFDFIENLKGDFGEITLTRPGALTGPGVVSEISALGVSEYGFPGRWVGLATVVVDDMMMTVPFKMKLSKSTSKVFGETQSNSRMASDKEARAPGGLYGFTKRTQRDVEASIRKLQRKAAMIAKRAYQQDEGVAPFLSLHAKRGKSTSARMLVAAMKTLGPKIASETEKEAAFSMGKKDKQVIDAFLDKKPMESKKLTTDGKRLDGSWMGGSGIARWVGGKIEMEDLGSKAAESVQRALKKKAPKNWIKAASDKEAAYGLYGYRAKTASLGLMACMQVKEAAGSIAADLHRRRMDRYAKITGFLDTHRKKARCMYARMLHRYYPDEGMKLAASGKYKTKLEALEAAVADLKKQVADAERKIRELSDIASPLGSEVIDVWLRKDKAHLKNRKDVLREVEKELAEERKNQKAASGPPKTVAEWLAYEV